MLDVSQCRKCRLNCTNYTEVHIFRSIIAWQCEWRASYLSRTSTSWVKKSLFARQRVCFKSSRNQVVNRAKVPNLNLTSGGCSSFLLTWHSFDFRFWLTRLSVLDITPLTFYSHCYSSAWNTINFGCWRECSSHAHRNLSCSDLFRVAVKHRNGRWLELQLPLFSRTHFQQNKQRQIQRGWHEVRTYAFQRNSPRRIKWKAQKFRILNERSKSTSNCAINAA